MFASKYIFFAVCASMASMSEAAAFLKAQGQHTSERVSEQDVQNSLLAEIEGSLGTGIASKRITEMKAVLGPMFTSLPKNQHGQLEHTTVRYALHRAFVQRHGWSIKGLDPAGEAWNASSPTGILKDQVPSYIQSLFEKRLGGRGLGLHELSVFGATIEHLVHNEAIGRLGAALNIHQMLPTDLMSAAEADAVLDTYMMAYIIGEHLSTMTAATATQLTKQMPEIYLAWSDTQGFVRRVRKELTESLGKAATTDTERTMDFATLVKVAETVGEQFGKFQDAECKGLKSSLVKMEDQGSGRVRLSEFYKPALDGAWQFQESIGYLRELGALDESQSDQPRVMLVNYLTSQANCIASSDYYSVCCIDECEDLFAHLEKEIAAPEATPERIAELISKLPSSSVSAPRALSATLRARLNDIAASHGGKVQLHGRLFAQWMHHAYPRECAFPHMSGTTSQQKPEAWTEGSGLHAVATEEELAQFTSSSASSQQEEVDDDVKQILDEETEEKQNLCWLEVQLMQMISSTPTCHQQLSIECGPLT